MALFENKLRIILNKIFTEADTPTDWEEFEKRREALRRQAAMDQKRAAEDELQQNIQGEMSRAGGFHQWLAGGHDWKPSQRLVYLPDVETGEGIILPSIRKRNPQNPDPLRIFIPWALLEVRAPHRKSDETLEGEITRIYPFCQFDDRWPNKSDFDWNEVQEPGSIGFTHDVTWNKRRRLNEKAAMALWQSEANHYHLLRGEDEAVIYSRCESKADDYIRDMEPESYEPDEDGWSWWNDAGPGRERLG